MLFERKIPAGAETSPSQVPDLISAVSLSTVLPRPKGLMSTRPGLARPMRFHVIIWRIMPFVLTVHSLVTWREYGA